MFVHAGWRKGICQEETVSYIRNGVKGEAEMFIIGTGNYTGECRKTFIVQ